jgi:hypothetical protein
MKARIITVGRVAVLEDGRCDRRVDRVAKDVVCPDMIMDK